MENHLKNKLQYEVALKGRASSLSFGLFSIFTFFYQFSLTKYAYIIQIFSVLVLIVAVLRLNLIKKIQSEKFVSEENWRLMKWMIWLNGIFWGIILNTASFELKLSGVHFVVVTTMIAGFVGASIVSLSYFRSLFVPFQTFLLMPQIFIIAYFYFFLNINYTPLIFLYLMYFVYQIQLYRTYHKEIVRLFKYQLELEKKNEKLKDSQKQLVDQTVQLVHASRLSALGEMSASIAHEINNPMAIIDMSGKTIEKEMIKSEINKDYVLATVEKISRSVNRVTKIVKGLRNLSHQGNQIGREKIPLINIIEETTFFCNEFLNAKNVKLTLGNIDEGLVDCNFVQISQVLINLIKNASDALLDEENFDEKWIYISTLKSDTHVKIMIQNGGKKIDEKIANKLFDPFFTTKPIGVGTGLGLSISKKIMKDHEGNIFIDLTQEKTTFVIELKIF